MGRRLDVYKKKLAEQTRQLEGLRVEIEKPFVHEAKLKALLKKQEEINEKLDLGRREQTHGLDADEERKAA